MEVEAIYHKPQSGQQGGTSGDTELQIHCDRDVGEFRSRQQVTGTYKNRDAVYLSIKTYSRDVKLSARRLPLCKPYHSMP